MSRPVLSVLLGTALFAGALTAADAQATDVQATAPQPVASGLPRVAAPTTVTLITGDKVTLTPGPDGTQVSMEAAVRPNGYRPLLRMTETNGRREVVPDDAGPLIASGVLDETLFDVSYLVENGYGDGAAKQLPLITQMASSVQAAKVLGQADAVPGVTPTAELSSLHAAAVDVPKAEAGAFWASITAGKASARSFQRSVAKVWLDRKVTASLDQSVPMIGAPQAWAAGYTGKGVKVAVLDTGIDPNHPDLKGRVTASKNFTPDPDIVDGFGHGTHVASIITGSGAASGGKYKGVAPDVDLMVGKVLDHTGSGLESDVIAGMEWAAAQGAKVINLSLGGDPYADDSQDPGAIAVDQLTASTGALFVIAAGNKGQAGASTVGSPGVAEAALTVASVDKSDKLAYYSSRGPLLSVNRVSKPDISGPGSDIVAARAAGTTMGDPVDANYTSASGTSMATPHVAGAAAILLQEHPDWSGPQLKAALMSTSKDDAYAVYEQGAGRVDVARAVTQQVVGVTSGVDFGRILDSEQGDVVRPVTYRNDSAADVTLSLRSSLRTTTGVDTSAAAAVPGQVVVPAHGTATVDVTVHAGVLAGGFSSGAVVATAGDTQVRTPLAMRKSRQTYPVHVSLKLSAPMYTDAYVNAFNAEDATVPPVSTYTRSSGDPTSGDVTLDLPPGHYWIRVAGTRHQASERLERVLFSEPDVAVQGPTELALDDKDAAPFRMATDTPTQPLGGGLVEQRYNADKSNGRIITEEFSAYGDGDYLVAPNKPVAAGGNYLINFVTTRGRPQLQLTADSANGRGLSMLPNYPGNAAFNITAPHLDGTWKKLPVVDIGWSLDPGELAGVRGKLVLMSFSAGQGGSECTLSGDDVAALKAAGAVGVLQESIGYMCEPYPYRLETDALPVAALDTVQAASLHALLAKGTVTVTLVGTPDAPTLYHLSKVLPSFPKSMSFQVHDRELARIRSSYTPEWQPGAYGAKSLAGQRLSKEQQPNLFQWTTYLNKVPLTRDELFGPIVPGQQWIRSAGTQNGLASTEERRTILHTGRMPDERWLGAPRSIGASDVPASATNLQHMGYCTACRDGDRLVVVPQYANSDPLVVPSLRVVGAAAKLYAGNQEIPGTLYDGGYPAFDLPAAAARYKLVLDTDLSSPQMARYPDLYRYGAKQHSEWTFSSQHVGTSAMGNTTCYQADVCAPQQLLYVRYSAPTDQSNKVAHGMVPLQLKPYYESTAKPRTATFKTVKVSASYDGGKSWKVVAGVNLRSVYQGLLLPPRGAKTVSLRVDATDQSGNSVLQTISDVFGVR
ncbi:S8 family peptidase [Kribbella sp. NPDC051587]|uniref:S8 family peptidase n=1 Tax=Kribbella sp. NPDC051587 TaxID=3364119 RepID=UPI00378D074C